MSLEYFTIVHAWQLIAVLSFGVGFAAYKVIKH